MNPTAPAVAALVKNRKGQGKIFVKKLENEQ